MEAPYFKVNGVDILPYTKESGIKWQRNDVESPNAGRTMDGAMHRGRVAIKFRADFDIRDLHTEDTMMILNLILPEFVEVETNVHPLYGYVVTSFYSNNVPATCVNIDKETGDAIWTGISFPLIEQ